MPYYNLAEICNKVACRFSDLNEGRDKVLKTQREVIRCASLSIRAIHRGEFDLAKNILLEASERFKEIEDILNRYKELYYSGYLLDSQKEFAEAHITYALVNNMPLPDPDELGVEHSSYMNGMGEAIGEMRRYILDKIRHDDFENGDKILDIMDELYCALTSMDYPDAITKGLRRTTDIARSIIEKTRGDLTQNLSQKRLISKLSLLGK